MAQRLTHRFDPTNIRILKGRAPTMDSLRAKVEETNKDSDGPDLGKMSHAERNKLLFGI